MALGPLLALEVTMSSYPVDHAGLETLPLDACLRLLASVPLGRIGFHADGETVILPVNYVVDGQDVIFRTAYGTKLAVAQDQEQVAFEADDYDERSQSGWSVLITGRAELVLDDSDIRRLEALRLHSWASGVDRIFWVRIVPGSITGRHTPRANGYPS